MKNLSWLALVVLVACGGSPVVAGAPPKLSSASPGAPRSLEEGMKVVGLTKIDLTTVKRETTHRIGDPIKVDGRLVEMNVMAGWSAQAPVFARGAGNKVYLVEPHPNVIVDRHVNGGCRGFYGGRMWSDTVVFELPPGTTWGGTHNVTWDEHTEVIDYTDHAPDGGPCPPPAID